MEKIGGIFIIVGIGKLYVYYIGGEADSDYSKIVTYTYIIYVDIY